MYEISFVADPSIMAVSRVEWWNGMWVGLIAPTGNSGHVDFGVKWQILPLCLKGKFYAKAVVVYITIAFYTIEFGEKSPCEESWPPLQKLLIHKGKILRQ